MSVGHAQPADGVFLEVELDQHDWFTTNNPSIVAGLDGDDLWSLVFDHAAVRVLDVNLPADEKPHVGVHAEVGAHDRLHVDRPSESRRIDHALDPRPARSSDFETHVPDFSKLGSFHRRQ